MRVASQPFVQVSVRKIRPSLPVGPARRAQILVSWPHSGGEIELKGDDVVQLFEQDIREYKDEINGKPFTVLAGDIKDYHHDLSGLHIGYGFRFIKKLNELAGHTLPALFYGRVILGRK